MGFFIDNYFGVFHGRVSDTEAHKHHAIQITIGHGKSFNIKFEDSVITSEFVLIKEDVVHQFIGIPDSAYTFIFLDSEAEFSFQLRNHYDLDLQKVVSLHAVSFKEDFLAFNDAFKTASFSPSLVNALLRKLVPLNQTSEQIDGRILKVIQHVQGKVAQELNLKALADVACLSESRLSHLFSEQIGIPIKRYLLWFKLRTAIAALSNGHSLSSAAHEAGFSDAPHFNRTFREMFGVSPSSINTE